MKQQPELCKDLMYICTDFYSKGWTDGNPHLMHVHEAGSISLQPNNMDETKIYYYYALFLVGFFI